MTGREAPVWVELNGILFRAIKEADQSELDLDDDTVKPGGSA